MREPYALQFIREARPYLDRLEKITTVLPTPTQAVSMMRDAPGFAAAMGFTDDNGGNTQAATTAAAALWRKTQFIYTFDGDLYDALAETSAAGELPGEILRRLPARSVWVDVPSRGTTALVTLDNKVSGEDEAIWVTLFDEFEDRHRCLSYIFGLNVSIAESVEKVYSSVDEAVREHIRDGVSDILACALYLCSEEPDITGAMSAMNKKRVLRRQLPYGPTICTVGYRVGAAFRKAKAEYEAAIADTSTDGTLSSGGNRIPHYRRAHWHTYWVGARGSEERRRILKWLSPVAVNVKLGVEVPAVSHPVHKEK